MRERFAPSPTGYLHLGHAFSALTAWDAAQSSGAEFLLRIEDIDRARCRPEYEAGIFDDLAWLGLSWNPNIMRQSTRMAAYQTALNQLISHDLCYPCSCTRRDILDALSAPQEGGGKEMHGADGVIYPGTCRHRKIGERTAADAVRLNMRAAIEFLGSNFENLSFGEIGTGQLLNHHLIAQDLVNICGDIVLARRDIGTSYHLAVVVDDAAQEISHVTRGRDMFEATKIHRLLQALLGLGTPTYRHHRLIRDEAGKRLAKRDDARAIQKYRRDGVSPAELRKLVDL